MKPEHLLGMVALAGALFLAMGAPSVSARTSGATPAETDVNATPHGVTSTSVSVTQPGILPTPSPELGKIGPNPPFAYANADAGTASWIRPNLGAAPGTGTMESPVPAVGFQPAPVDNSSFAPGAQILPVRSNSWA